jgi:hypothetical protein
MHRLCFLSSLLTLVATASAPVLAETPVKRAERVTFTSSIKAGDVRPHIEFLAGEELKGRRGANARRAGEYIARHFRKAGLKPLFADRAYFQDIPGVVREDGRKPTIGRNVGAWLPGSDPKLQGEFIIVSAHYDHLGVRGGKIYRGADDNASGVSMLLEVAEQFAQLETRPKRSLVFVGFDLEEHMLWGSRWFAAHPPWELEKVKLFITADMIGRSLGNLALESVFVLGSEHAPQLKTVLDEIGRPKKLAVARMGIDLIGTRSDYGPFRDRKVPFLFFSTGEHPDYHTPKDLPARIDYEQVARVSGLVLRLSTAVANRDEVPVWTDDAKPGIDEVRALHAIATRLLEAEDGHKLNQLQSLLVSQTRNKTQQIIDRGTITDSERAWLIRASQLMLLSIF